MFDFMYLCFIPYIIGNIKLGKAIKRVADHHKDRNITIRSSNQDAAEEQFKGTQYEDIVSSNPYENVEYQNGILDSIGDVFGFRTAQDKFREDLALRSAEHINQVNAVAREEEYNSEAAKIARMKKAGLNPDLMGLESASEATEFSEPETSPEAPSAMTGADALSHAIQLGANFTSTLSTLGNFILTLEHTSLINEGLEIENATGILGLTEDASSLFDTDDVPLDLGDPSEEGSEAVALSPSQISAGRNKSLVKALFGSTTSKAAQRALAALNAHNGTLNKSIQHLSAKAAKAVAEGTYNVESAKIGENGRSSRSNANLIESAFLRSTLNDAFHDARMAEIENEFIQDPNNADLVKQGLINEATEAAEYDPHLAAAAANAASVGDAAQSYADVDEARARSKEAALAEENARWKAEQLKIIEDLYNGWKNSKNPFRRRKYMRQLSHALGYGVVNEPSISGSLAGGGNASYSASKRTSSSVVRRILPK